jgi:hypothetical protein
MESAITAHASAAATIHPVILFDSIRHNRGQRACLAGVTAGDTGGGYMGGGDIGGDMPWGVVGS